MLVSIFSITVVVFIKNLKLFLFNLASMTPAIDVYSFGMCALEMAALEIQGNGDSGNLVTDENINRTIDSLEDPQQQDFIHKCLHKDADQRPTARELLFHPLLYEVHSLKLLAAHCLVNTAGNCFTSLFILIFFNHTRKILYLFLMIY